MLESQFKTENLAVRHYLRDPSRLIVAFASAGARRVDGYSEEFGRTLEKFGVSTVFVTDRQARWFNHKEADEVLNRVGAIAAGFQNVGAVGESLGGSGALLFSRFAPNVSRVLALTPQYSVAQPFIRFDDRYLSESKKIERFYYGTFAEASDPRKSVILYGNRSWRDYIHRAMFESAGYQPLIIDGAPHEISRHLKNSQKVNNLALLFSKFCDFAEPFNSESVKAIDSIEWTDCSLRDEESFATSIRDEIEFAKLQRERIPVPQPVGDLISKGMLATQSSVSDSSEGRSREEDAGRAVSGTITGHYSFHTATENNPWWKVDLGGVRFISEIRLFNRLTNLGVARRAYNFDILISNDNESWEIILSPSLSYFGGIDGRPFIYRPDPFVQARWVQIMLKQRTSLHLDQVQVFSCDY